MIYSYAQVINALRKNGIPVREVDKEFKEVVINELFAVKLCLNGFDIREQSPCWESNPTEQSWIRYWHEDKRLKTIPALVESLKHHLSNPTKD
jgi:hypothetical protein